MPTKISWTRGDDGSPGETWNPTLGCTKVSPGCDGCYAIRQARIREANPNSKIAAAYDGLVARTASGLDWTGRVNQLPDRLDLPLRWRKPRRVFVDSMSDLFHDAVSDEFIARVVAVMIAAPMHTFQVLTKRHARQRSLLRSVDFWTLVSRQLGRLWNAPASAPLKQMPAWIWMGVSVEDQASANLRIPALIETPAAVRWVSAEPLLGWVDMTSLERRPGGPLIDALAGDVKTRDGEVYAAAPGCIDWVVAGGESGPAARPMDPAWARSLRDQCTAAGVPFHFKQWGEVAPLNQLPTQAVASWELRNGPGYPPETFCRVGVKAAGRELDGHVHDEYPNDKSGATP